MNPILKLITRVCILVFTIGLFYDAITVYRNRKNFQQGNQLIVVRREIEEPKKTRHLFGVDKPFDFKFPPWYLALGVAFPGLMCLVFCLKKLQWRAVKMVKTETTSADPIQESCVVYAEGNCRHSQSETDQKGNLDGFILDGDVQERKSICEKVQDFQSVSHAPDFQGDEPSSNLAEILLGSNMKILNEDTPCENVITKSEIQFLQMPENDLSTIFLQPDIYNPNNTGTVCPDVTFVTLQKKILQAMTCSASGILAAVPNETIPPKNEPNSEFTKDDLNELISRQEKLEKRLSDLENITEEGNKRLDLAESELIDLHEQMYTILRSIEDSKKSNYIIVSQMPKELSNNENDKVSETPCEVEKEQSKPIDSQSKNVMDPRRRRKKNQDSMREEVLKSLVCCVENFSTQTDRPTSAGSSTRSVALEAILEKDISLRSTTAPPKKANPKVPTHILPPYKRSTFTATDSLSEIRKVKLRLLKARS